VCGDHYTNSVAEDCDPGTGKDTPICNGSAAGLGVACRVPTCGDGYTNTSSTPPGATAPEECDNLNGVDTATCNGNNHGNNGPGACRHPACHDGYLNAQAGEECEVDGDCGAGRICNNSCRCI
jgi:hypothetical protein